jgi:hypothetical protein
MHNMTICICSDSKAALLALSSYTISSKLLHQCWLSLQDLSNNNRVRLFWVLGHCDIKGSKEADGLAKIASDSHFCGPEPCVPLSASIVRDLDSSINVLFDFFSLSFCFFYFIFFRLISLFTSHLGQHIRPKQGLPCRNSASIRSGSTLLNPSIQLDYSNPSSNPILVNLGNPIDVILLFQICTLLLILSLLQLIFLAGCSTHYCVV